MSTMFFKLISDKDIPWDIMQNCDDHTVFKSKEWANFLENTYHVKPFVIEISENEKVIGYFYGQRTRKFGLKIVASPFEGWSTSYQGLTMLAPISVHKRIDIYEVLISWLFKNNYCHYFQVSDWQLDLPECLHREKKVRLIKGYLLDLTKNEDDLYKQMSSRAKDPIKKSIKRGVSIVECSNIIDYAQNYQKQLQDVFRQQGISPTHSQNQTISMLSSLASNKKMLALYAIDESGESIASSFYVYDNHFAFYAGAASYKEKQILCPNEPLMWEAIKELKKRGVKQLEFGGGRRYKEKYGPKSIVKPQIIAAKYFGIIEAKDMAKKLFYGLRSLVATLSGTKVNSGQNMG